MTANKFDLKKIGRSKRAFCDHIVSLMLRNWSVKRSILFISDVRCTICNFCMLKQTSCCQNHVDTTCSWLVKCTGMLYIESLKTSFGYPRILERLFSSKLMPREKKYLTEISLSYESSFPQGIPTTSFEENSFFTPFSFQPQINFRQGRPEGVNGFYVLRN